jgi:hypothetical protein
VAGIRVDTGWAKLPNCRSTLFHIETILAIGDQVAVFIPGPANVDVLFAINPAVNPTRTQEDSAPTERRRADA